MKRYLGVLFLALLFIAPATTHAQINLPLLSPDFQIVPPECNCDEVKNSEGELVQSAPGYGCVLQLIQNVINAAVSFGILVVVVMIAYAGVLFIFSSTNPALRTQGKKAMWQAIVGLVITLSAWLVVDFVMKTLYGEPGRWGPWNSILLRGAEEACIIPSSKSPELPGLFGVIPSTGGTGGRGANCPAGDPSVMVEFPAEATQGDTEMATEKTVENFLAMRAAALKEGIDLKITDAYRPESEQVALWNQYCSSGTCGATKVAKPCSLGGGGSNHNSGLAIDISVGCSNGQSGCNTATYNWLKENGVKWGFRNALPTDPLHWSPTGR